MIPQALAARSEPRAIPFVHSESTRISPLYETANFAALQNLEPHTARYWEGQNDEFGKS